MGMDKYILALTFHIPVAEGTQTGLHRLTIFSSYINVMDN